MANPVVLDLIANEWNLVAEGITTGQLSVLGNQPSIYLRTYRLNGEPAPSSDTTEGIRLSRKSVQIRSRNLIDVYVYPQLKGAKVRIDL